MAENIIVGGILGLLAGDILRPKRKEDYLARAKVCNALQDYYTKDKMTSYYYDWCLQHGPTDMMSFHGSRFRTHKN